MVVVVVCWSSGRRVVAVGFGFGPFVVTSCDTKLASSGFGDVAGGFAHSGCKK